MMTIAIGEYSNSYSHMLREQGMNPTGQFAYRLSEGQVDDTCFSWGKTFCELKDALADLVQATDAAAKGDKAAAEYAAVLAQAILHAETGDNIDSEPF